MKKLLFAIVIFLCISGMAQTSVKNSAIVQYKIINNTDAANTARSTLYIDGASTLYIASFGEKVYKDAKVEAEAVKDGYKEYMKYDHKKKELLFFEYMGHQPMLITDTYNKLAWDITGETKTIAGYECIKATVDFRGRKWIAWFAPDIPLSYGPWKLHGLPGLIIQAYDETEKYIWRAEKIEYIKDAVMDRDFSTLLPANNKKPMTLKQYSNDEAERKANVMNEFLRTNPNVKIESNPVPKTGYELEYEWEK